ncbi:MAG: folate-binding protein [Opitutaceae bacterium]
MLKGGFHLYRPGTWLSVRGSDAASFLQGQFTNDLRAKIAHSCTYGLFLDRKGKVRADGFVMQAGENDFRILSYESDGADLRERLEAFVIADDVEIGDKTGEVEGIAFLGEEAVGWLETQVGRPGPGQFLEVDSGWVFQGRRSLGPQLEWILPGDLVEDALNRLRADGLVELERPVMERERIRSRAPSIPREIGPSDLPQEGGLERDAVSFTKGCYLGQEVMARLRAMGRVRRSLVAVHVAGHPAVPARLYDGDREVGELRSVVPGDGIGVNGMALIRTEAVGRELSIEPGGPARVVISGGAIEDDHG